MSGVELTCTVVVSTIVKEIDARAAGLMTIIFKMVYDGGNGSQALMYAQLLSYDHTHDHKDNIKEYLSLTPPKKPHVLQRLFFSFFRTSN